MNRPIFHGYYALPTTAEVYDALFSEHQRDMDVFSTFTNADQGPIETVWGIRGADYPLIALRTTYTRTDYFLLLERAE